MTQQHELLKQQQKELLAAAEFALTFAQKKGAQAQVAVTKSSGISVSTRLREVENIEFNHDGALGISVYLGEHKGNASTSDLSAQAVQSAVEAAIDIARYTSADPCTGLADKALLEFNPPDLDLYHPTDLPVEQAIELALSAENAALDYDAKISNSEGASLNAHSGISVYGNTHGVLNSHLSSRYSLSCSVIATEQGDMQREYEYTISRRFDQLATPQWIGQQAAKKSLSRLNAQKLATCNSPVIFHADVATGLIASLVGAISGSSIYRKSSFLLDQLGQQIFPEWFAIEERPHLLQGLASTPFDSEGVKTRDHQIIESGILQTYLLTTYSGKKLGLPTTGHAGGIHNWRVKPNALSGLDALLKQMNRGLLVTDLMGHGVNLVTGDYSQGAAGFWVENGEIQYPVHEITIAGNLKTMYQNIVAVANDLERRSNIQTGSILIEQMKISGN